MANVDAKIKLLLETTKDTSQIVDENGEPMVVYHYTPNEFTEFDTEKLGSSTDVGAFGTDFYLSPSDDIIHRKRRTCRNGIVRLLGFGPDIRFFLFITLGRRYHTLVFSYFFRIDD